MTDGQTLFAVFALLYLIECLRLVPSTAWMAAGAEKMRWSVIRPWMRLQIGGGSPCCSPRCRPCRRMPSRCRGCSFPNKMSLRVRLTDGMSATIAWDKLSLRVEETTLQLDAATRVRLPTPALADLDEPPR
jgi:hypothetical protein